MQTTDMRQRPARRLFALLLATATLTAASLSAQTEAKTEAGSETEAAPLPHVAEWSEDLRTLAIDDELLGEGIGYFLIKGEDAQVRVGLDSGLTKVYATTSAAGGYLVGPWDVDEVEDDQSPLIAGAIRIPTASLTTETRFDGMLQSGMVLDAANHEDISFVFEQAAVRERRAGPLTDSTAFDLDLTGSLVFKGQAFPLQVDAELVLYLSSNDTMNKTVGDLARLTGSFELTAEQLNLHPRVAAMMGAKANVEFFLMYSNVDPRRPILPPSTPRAYTLSSRYLSSLNDRNDAATAFAAGEELIKAAWDDPVALSAFAVSAVFEADASRRFVGQAQRAAQRAVDLGGDDPDPMALNVLAKIAAETGALDRAIELQERAIALAQSGAAARAKPTMEANLELYRELSTIAAGEAQ